MRAMTTLLIALSVAAAIAACALLANPGLAGFGGGGRAGADAAVEAFYGARMRMDYAAIASLYADDWGYSQESARGMYAPVDGALGRLQDYSVTDSSFYRWRENGGERQAGAFTVHAVYANGEADEVLKVVLTGDGWKVDGWLIDVESSLIGGPGG